MMSKKINDIEHIKSLQNINGISIQEIERRAQPLLDKTQDAKCWKCRSFNGFLNNNQTFKECLIQDWETVYALGTTHVILANHLRAILSQAEEIRRNTKRGPDYTIQIKYSAKDIVGAKEQVLRISHRFYTGEQWSLFYNEQSSEEIEKWREDYYISNDAMGLSITLGGGLKGGIIFYIENYGFYEGGTNNEYRIEPDKLVALLTGKMTSRVIKNQIIKLEQKIEQCKAQLKEYQQEMETALQKIDVSCDNYLEEKKESRNVPKGCMSGEGHGNSSVDKAKRIMDAP